MSAICRLNTATPRARAHVAGIEELEQARDIANPRVGQILPSGSILPSLRVQGFWL